ncbi:MAG: GMC family oxidoreductase, partial [candidate division KSB1 bacterium]
AAGAEAVYPASFVDLEMQASRFKSDVDIERFIRENLRKPDDMILTSSHPQGGNIMSNDCSMGVVDSNFKVHGYNNLFVCDASVFPTSLGVNPQLTIMALADYACQTRMIY